VTGELLDDREPVPAGSLLGGLPPPRVVPDALALIRAENERTGTRVAVLDDDPTGTQTSPAFRWLPRGRSPTCGGQWATAPAGSSC
jgi:hypothetical protein